MKNILTSESRQKAMLNDLTNFETHPNHMFYQIERVMVFNILRNIGETTPSKNLLKNPPHPPKYMLKQTLKKDVEKTRKHLLKNPKKLLKIHQNRLVKKQRKKTPPPPSIDYTKLIEKLSLGETGRTAQKL